MSKRSFRCLLQFSRLFGGSNANTPVNSRASSGTRGRAQASPSLQQSVSSPGGSQQSGLTIPTRQEGTTSSGGVGAGMGTPKKLHVKARCENYPRANDIKRFKVPDEYVPWQVKWDVYAPVDYTSPSLITEPLPPWADLDVRHKDGESPVDPALIPKWNAVDKNVRGKEGSNVDRTSFEGKYEIDETGVPRNPRGRTGLRGRGCLGRWGPNHAADPIVTRWKLDEDGKQVREGGRPVAQFIAVQRRDNHEWAIPGGMVDPKEEVSVTLKREFGEEALNSLEATEEERKEIEDSVSKLFQQGKEIYRGYVDDPRNTDNSWMETVAMNFHDAEGTGVARFKLHAGDDAMGVQWMDLSHKLDLYADHTDFLEKTAQLLGASW